MDPALHARLTELEAKLKGADAYQSLRLLDQYQDVVAWFEMSEKEAAMQARLMELQPKIAGTNACQALLLLYEYKDAIVWLRNRNIAQKEAAMYARLMELESKLRIAATPKQTLSLLNEYEDAVTWSQCRNNTAQRNIMHAHLRELESKLIGADSFQTWRLLDEYEDVLEWWKTNVLPPSEASTATPYAQASTAQPIPPGGYTQDENPRDTRTPLPTILQILQKKKNIALKDYNRFPSPDNRKLLRTLQRELKWRVAEFRARENAS